MLLRFGVSNFRSINAYQSISLVASGLKDMPEQPMPFDDGPDRALPLLAIYGANAAGKSNLLMAIHRFRSLILNSQTKGEPGGGVPHSPFLLVDEPERSAAQSQFDCDFVQNKIRYHFGIKYDGKQILEEWLYAYPEGNRQVWYHRNVKEGPTFYFGKNMKGKNRTIEGLTRANSLYLSAAAQNNHEQLLPVYNFFRHQLRFPELSELLGTSDRDNLLQQEDIRQDVITFLRQADTGISGLRIRERDLPEELGRLATELNSLVKKFAGDAADPIHSPAQKVKELEIAHSGVEGREVYFGLEAESRGTRALLNILPPVLKALRDGATLSLDELTTSVHTALAQALLKLFASGRTNPNGAQLLFTTHDTNLLSAGVLRRDSIWFAEKDQGGATSFYPLTDIKTRNTDNLEKGYLEGRYGAIPYVGDIKTLLGSGG